MTAATVHYGYGSENRRRVVLAADVLAPLKLATTARTIATMHPVFLSRVVAMSVAAGIDGVSLHIGGGFRTSEQQESMFRDRYTSHKTPPGIRWVGKYWRKRRGVAQAAPPGLSYHEPSTPSGHALAVDLCRIEDGRVRGISRGGDQDVWMGANAARFGLVQSVRSERWHVTPVEIPASRRYFNRWDAGSRAGWYDATLPAGVAEIAAAVRSVETVEHLPPFRPERRKWSVYPLAKKPVIQLGEAGDLVRYLQGVLSVVAFLNSGQVPPPGPLDGQFGPRVHRSVLGFQGREGLVADGKVGRNTWSAIDRWAAWSALG